MMKARGIDLEIARGFGSMASAQSIAGGQFDFGIVAAPSLILSIAKNLPLIALATCDYDSTMGVGVLEDSPILKPQDLAGKKIASVPTSGEFPFFPAYARKVGLDMNSIEIVHVDNKVLERVLIEKQVDAITSFGLGSAAVMLSKGIPSRWMLYSAAGIRNHGQTIATQRKTPETDPALCEAITDGLLEALAYTLTNPQDSLELFQRGGARDGAQPQLQRIRPHRARHVAARHRSPGGARARAGMVRPGRLCPDDRSRDALPDGARSRAARSRGGLHHPLCGQDQAGYARVDRCPHPGLRIRQVSELTNAFPRS